MDKEYFKVIYMKYFKLLHTYSLRIVHKEEVAEDIVQEVFLECWNRRDSIDVTVSLKPYLYILTRRKSIDFLRKYERKNLLFSEIETKLDQFLFDALTIEDDVDTKDVEKDIENSILLLPAKCKDVFLLSRVNGLKNKQISESLGISVKTVEKHITKAMKHIKDTLKEKGHILFLISVFMFFHK